MENLKTTTLIIIFIFTGLFLYNCTGGTEQSGDENINDPTTLPDTDDSAGMSNPASVYCEEQGGTLEIRTKDDGSQFGVCIFEDGSECEEWAFFRGECQPGQSIDSAANMKLTNMMWVLKEFGQPLVPDAAITIEFTDDGQIKGAAGCNSYFGGYTLEGTNLLTGPVGSTQMWCDGLMDQETAYLKMLQSATGLTVSAGELTIHTPDGDMTFAPAENISLEDADWVLSGIAQDDAVVSTWIDENITIKFADGQVNGNSGCNSFSGSYEIDGHTLTLTPLISTMMACEEEVNERETEFLAALETVSQFRTEMSQLILTDADGKDILFFTVQSS